MQSDRLTELKNIVTSGLYFDDHTQVFTAYLQIPSADRDALLALIEAEQARIVPDEEVQDAIYVLSAIRRNRMNVGFTIFPNWAQPIKAVEESLDLAIRILSAYRKPSADQAEQIDRAIEIFQAHIDEAGKIVGHKPDCKYCEASRTGITALNRMKGEGK